MFTLDQVCPGAVPSTNTAGCSRSPTATSSARILGCADGPASFNTEATRRGTDVVSSDPLYRYDVSQIRERIAATRDQALEQTRQNAAEFVWDTIASVEQPGRGANGSHAGVSRRLRDRQTAGAVRRRGTARRCRFPIAPSTSPSARTISFCTPASSPKRFTRRRSIELCRVAREVRIFLLLALGGRQSPYVEPVVDFEPGAAGMRSRSRRCRTSFSAAATG